MFRAMILLCAVLALAPGALAARAAHGGAGASPRFSSARATSRSPAPQPRGGPGTLGGYQQRPPVSSRVPYPGGYYLVPYYPGGYYNGLAYDPFYFDPFYGDPFFAGPRVYASPGYRSEEGWSERGNVHLQVEPKDVEVIVDGIPSAKGGRAALDLPSGMHHIEIHRSGYRTWSVDLDVKQGVRYRLEQRLERLPKVERQQDVTRSPAAGRGEARLNVQPADTIVDLDGRFLGMADLLRDSATLHRLPVGRHKLRFSRPGYETVEREIDISPDRRTEVRVELERK